VRHFRTFCFLAAGIKPRQTFAIILPNLIHKSKEKKSEKEMRTNRQGEAPPAF